MKALDTNILVRFLVNDDERQAKKVFKLFQETENEKGILFVPLLVVIELIWVLDSAYSCSKQDIIESLHELLQMPILKFETQPVIQSLVVSALNENYDLSDILIAHSAIKSGCDNVITFDKIASKHKCFALLK